MLLTACPLRHRPTEECPSERWRGVRASTPLHRGADTGRLDAALSPVTMTADRAGLAVRGRWTSVDGPLASALVHPGCERQRIARIFWGSWAPRMRSASVDEPIQCLGLGAFPTRMRRKAPDLGSLAGSSPPPPHPTSPGAFI